MNRIALLAICLGLAGSASTQVLLNTGFEPTEGYTVGNLTGQQSWVQITSANPDPAAQVQTSIVSSGGRSVAVDANQAVSSDWWYKPLNFNVTSSSNKVIRVTWDEYLVAPSGTASFSNTSIYGILCYDSAGTFIQGLYADNFDASVWYYDPALSTPTWVKSATATARNSYRRYGLTLNYADNIARFEVGGTVLAESATLNTNNGVFGDADIFLGFATTDKAYFDNLKVEAIPTGTIRGVVTLADFSGDLTTKSVTVEIRNPGSTTALDTKTVALAADGSYSISTSVRGVKDLAFKSNTHLRKVVPNINVLANGTFGIDVALPYNGDIDNDNVVTVFDYGVLSDYFDKSSSDGDWLTVGGNGWRPVDADLDGDGVISVFDYGYISDNFDRSGDD